MGKPTLDINNLISFIKNNKKIDFNSVAEENRLKKMIEQHTYLNIFSLKYLFSDGINRQVLSGNKSKYTYQYNHKTKYSDLEKKFNQLLKFEIKLREGVLLFETELKSQFIFFLEDFFKSNNIDFTIFLNSLKEYDHIQKAFVNFNTTKIRQQWSTQTSNYSQNYQNLSDYYYLLIKILSFGTIGRILDANYQGTKVFLIFNNYLKRSINNFNIGKKIEEIESIIILRNSLCHKESLVMFLEKGHKKNLLLKNSTNYLQLRINAVSHIYEYYEKNVNKRIKKLDTNSWIKKYLKYRLNNGKNNISFKKIKIYL